MFHCVTDPTLHFRMMDSNLCVDIFTPQGVIHSVPRKPVTLASACMKASFEHTPWYSMKTAHL